MSLAVITARVENTSITHTEGLQNAPQSGCLPIRLSACLPVSLSVCLSLHVFSLSLSLSSFVCVCAISVGIQKIYKYLCTLLAVALGRCT